MNESNVEPLITPLQQIDGVWVKFEHLNPSGSIKDRVARHVLEEGLRSGSLVPGIVRRHRSLVDDAMLISDQEALEETRRLNHAGDPVGHSSGTNMTIALRLKRQGLNVVTFFCDSIDRYRSLPEFADL